MQCEAPLHASSNVVGLYFDFVSQLQADRNSSLFPLNKETKL